MLYISIEMTLDAFGARMASMATYERWRPDRNIPYMKAINNTLDVVENERFVRAGLEMGKLPVTIEEGTSISTAKITALVRQSKREFAEKGLCLGVVVVDLIGKVAPRDPRASVLDQLTQISADLTALGKSENVAMLALHQLNRNVESRENKRPRKSDLRAAGTLEEDADAIWMLYREEYYMQEEDTAGKTPAEILERSERLRAAKNRMEIIVEKKPPSWFLRHGACVL